MITDVFTLTITRNRCDNTRYFQFATGRHVWRNWSLVWSLVFATKIQC